MKKRQGRYTAAFAILLVLVLVFLVLNVCIGSVNIPVSEIPKILFGNGADDCDGYPFPESAGGSNPGWRSGAVWLSSADLFS